MNRYEEIAEHIIRITNYDYEEALEILLDKETMAYYGYDTNDDYYDIEAAYEYLRKLSMVKPRS